MMRRSEGGFHKALNAMINREENPMQLSPNTPWEVERHQWTSRLIEPLLANPGALLDGPEALN